MRKSEKVLIGKDKNEKENGDDVRYNRIEGGKELSRVTLRYGFGFPAYRYGTVL